MGMQGMQGSHFPSYMNFVGLPASPVGRSLPFTPQGKHFSSSGSTSLPSPLVRGRPTLPPAPSSAWARYTRYSPSPASSSPKRIIFHSEASSTASAPSEKSIVLAGKTSLTGTQAHYNPAFFAQQQQGQLSSGSSDANWNPHGAKRTRQE